jgi:Bifunctional DNA primase/polymerase, N-terminal
MPNPSLIMAALEAYTARGWHLFRCTPLGKEPLVSKRHGGRGVHDATASISALQASFEQTPAANLAVATGRASDLTVIDIDPKNGGEASVAALAAKGFIFPRTLRAITPSGGFHLYYRFAPGVLNWSGKLAPGIDTRSQGGYCLIAPSQVRRKEDGKTGHYQWMDTETGEIRESAILTDADYIAPFPQWALEILCPPRKPEIFTPIRPLSSARAQERLQRQSDIIASVREGNRNGSLSSRAFFAYRNYIASGFASPLDVEARLVASSIASGLTAKEARETVQKAFEQAKRKSS